MAISFQSQITVLLLQFTLPTFACLLERARLQSFIVIGTSPLSQSVHSGEWEKVVSTRRVNESTVFYLRVFLVQTGLLTSQRGTRTNCDLALKRNSQIFPIIISQSGQFGFEQPNHFFPNFIYGSIHRKAKSPPVLGGSPTF